MIAGAVLNIGIPTMDLFWTIVGAAMFVLGGWVCIQSATTRIAPAVAIGGLILMVMCWPASARDLDGRYAQSPLKQWFDQLKSQRGPCCSDADGYALSDVDWDTENGKYRVRIEGKWWDVPEDAVITEPNRAGRTMVWPLLTRGLDGVLHVNIRCFMPGSMT